MDPLTEPIDLDRKKGTLTSVDPYSRPLSTLTTSGVHILDQDRAGGVSRGGRADSAAQEEEEASALVRALPEDSTQERLYSASCVSQLSEHTNLDSPKF